VAIAPVIRLPAAVRATALVVVAACGCLGSGPPGASPPTRPPDAAGVAATPPGDAQAGASSEVLGPDDGVPSITVLLDDPRLAAVRECEQAHDDAGASAAAVAAMASASPAPEQACPWWYLIGRLHLAANEPADAAVAFEHAAGGGDAGPACPLAEYASLRHAQALLRTGDYDGAAAAARAAGTGIAARDEAKLALAEAFAASGDRARSVPLWREWLSSDHHPLGSGRGTPRWVDVSLRLATALLDGVDGPPRDRAAEALDLATQVLVDAPIAAERTDVLAVRARAAAAAGKALPSLSFDDRAAQAKAWLDTSRPERAKETAEALLRVLGPKDKAGHAAGCRAAIVLAQASPSRKGDDVADPWTAAIARCEGEDDLVNALYGGAKASAAAKRYAEAIARFERVEQTFPKHRLADDAHLRAAAAAAAGGDAARSEALLTTLVDQYPEGDMRSEALVRLGLMKLSSHDYAAAGVAFDRAIELAHDDRAQGVGGRAAYFRARVADLSGALDDAKDRYAALVEGEPLSYYMLLAYARLRVLDEGRARASRETAEAREPPGRLVATEHAEFRTPAFERFRRLLEVGELDAARRELAVAGLLGDSVEPEVLWAVAAMFERAGAPDVGHAFARGRLVDYRSHWPAGRWRQAWEIAFPRVWEPIVTRESAAAGITPALVWGIMREESAFNPEAKSAANAFGLMQLIVPTARLAAKGTALSGPGVDEDALKEPDVSIALGARVFGSLRRSFPGYPAFAVAAYNAGPRAVRRWLSERSADDVDVFVDRIAFDETRAYVKRVLASAAAYAYLYAPDALDDLLTIPPGAVSSLR
jgi:soluble lytic murein transglycosylase